MKKTMKNMIQIVCVAAIVAAFGSVASADDFGTGGNEFTIDFVAISGATNPASGRGIVDNDYRMGVHEITNAQWDKFRTELAPVTVTGSPSIAYDGAPHFTGSSVPTNMISWYEAAQMVNWLNTSTGHQAAYKFTGTQGTSNYALDTWSAAEADGGTNLYRHKDAFYFLPTDDEWVKAGYWNGMTIQTYANISDTVPVKGVDSNYDGIIGAPWDVGSGSEELNGTYDMMGNVWEWLESPYADTSYGADSLRGSRAGSYFLGDEYYLRSSTRLSFDPNIEATSLGFRVASEVPEPATMSILAMGGLAVLRRRKRVESR